MRPGIAVVALPCLGEGSRSRTTRAARACRLVGQNRRFRAVKSPCFGRVTMNSPGLASGRPDSIYVSPKEKFGFRGSIFGNRPDPAGKNLTPGPPAYGQIFAVSSAPLGSPSLVFLRKGETSCLRPTPPPGSRNRRQPRPRARPGRRRRSRDALSDSDRRQYPDVARLRSLSRIRLGTQASEGQGPSPRGVRLDTDTGTEPLL